MKTIILPLILVSFLLIVLSETNAFSSPQETLRIGWIGPLTEHAAILGVDALEATRMGLEKVQSEKNYKGPRLELVVEDDQMTTIKTVTAYNKLVHSQGVKVIMIYAYGGLFAVAPKAEKDNVLLIDPLDCDEDIAKLPSNTVCIAKLTEDFGKLLAASIIEKGELPSGVLYFENDPFPLKTATSFRDQVNAQGHQLNVFEGYQADKADFRSLLLKAKSKHVKSLLALGYAEIGTLLVQAKAIGLSAQIYTLATVESPDILAIAGEATTGVEYPEWKAVRTPVFKEFRKAFIARTGRAPFIEVSTVPSYDIAVIIATALNTETEKTTSVVPKLKNAFYSLKDYPGVSGPITMDPDGVVRSFTVRMGKIQR